MIFTKGIIFLTLLSVMLSNVLMWWNGRHRRLKIFFSFREYGFKSHHQYYGVLPKLVKGRVC